MLSILLIWIYIFVLTSVAGFLLQVTIYKNKFKEQSFSNPILLSVIGYCIITAAISIYALFFKVALVANLLLILSEVIGCIIFKKQFMVMFQSGVQKMKEVNAKQLFIFLIIIFNVLFMNIKGVYFDSDTGLYHAQVIQWIEKYPAIPGLGNLYPNYAFNSSFFISSALFSFTFLNDFSYHVLNSYFLLILMVYLIQNIKGKDYRNAIYAFLVIPTFYFFKLDAALPYPDIIIYILEIFVFMVIMEKIKSNSLQKFDFKSLIICLIILTCITTKLSALPVIFVLPLMLFYTKNIIKAKHLFTLCFFTLIVMAPWLVRNVIISGYLVFPYPSIDVFNYDWKVPYSEAVITKSWICSHARILEQYDDFQLTFKQWFPIWFGNQLWVNVISLLIAVVGMIVLSLIIFTKKVLGKIASRSLFYFGVTYLLCILFWFMMAPAFRFGQAYIFVCIAIIIFYCLEILMFNKKLIQNSIVILLLLFAGYSSIWPIKMIASGEINLKQHLIYPEIKYKPIVVVEKNLNGLIISMPVGNRRCWNQPIPCTPRLYNSIQLRGTDLSSGFKIVRADSVTVSASYFK